MSYAKGIVEKVWNQASTLGYSDYFIPIELGHITDDHIPVNETLGIPCIDIINFNDEGFPTHWHTQNDNMQNIDKATLNVVGQTLLNVVYNEQ